MSKNLNPVDGFSAVLNGANYDLTQKFAHSLTGAATRKAQERMRDTVHLSDWNDGVRTYTQMWQAALASGAKKLYVDVGGTLTAQIDIPDFVYVYSDMSGGVAVGKGFNGDLFTMGSYSQIHGLWINGNGATYTGRSVVIGSGKTDQRISFCWMFDSAGPCIEMTAVNAGTRSFIFMCELQCTTASNPAIKLPAGEALTDGTRYISHIATGGGVLIDLNGSNMTVIDFCNCAGILFTASTKQVYVSNTRIATLFASLTIDGPSNANFSHCAIGGNIVINGTAVGPQFDGNNVAGSLTLNSGATFVRADDSNNFQSGIVDNSASTTNFLDYEADITPTWGADTTNPALGNGNMNARIVRKGKLMQLQLALGIGSTTTFGTGDWFFQMPAGWNMNVKRQVQGAVKMFDASATTYYSGAAHVGAGAAPKIYVYPHGSTSGARNTAPFSWAQNDTLDLTITWEIG